MGRSKSEKVPLVEFSIEPLAVMIKGHTFLVLYVVTLEPLTPWTLEPYKSDIRSNISCEKRYIKWKAENYKLSNACPRSSHISSTASIPTDNRNRSAWIDSFWRVGSSKERYWEE